MMLNYILIPVVRQGVANTPIGMRSDQRQPLPNRDLESNIDQTTGFLTGKAWLHRQFTVKDPDGTECWRLVFADPNHIKILAKREHLTLCDCPHELNKWAYNMFSFLVRNEHDMWIPGAHCVVEMGGTVLVPQEEEHPGPDNSARPAAFARNAGVAVSTTPCRP